MLEESGRTHNQTVSDLKVERSIPGSEETVVLLLL